MRQNRRPSGRPPVDRVVFAGNGKRKIRESVRCVDRKSRERPASLPRLSGGPCTTVNGYNVRNERVEEARVGFVTPTDGTTYDIRRVIFINAGGDGYRETVKKKRRFYSVVGVPRRAGVFTVRFANAPVYG